IARPTLFASVAAALAGVALAWPIMRQRLLNRAARSALMLATLVTVVCTGDRIVSAWEERTPRFGVASAFASGALNLLGYRAANERGLLILDHHDGPVAIVPSMDHLAIRPLSLFVIAWAVLWLVHVRRRAAAAVVVALMVTIVVGFSRYVILLAIYDEY